MKILYSDVLKIVDEFICNDCEDCALGHEDSVFRHEEDG